MTVNHKKIYRLCKENSLLLQRKKKINQFKKLAENHKITGPNQLWKFDIKLTLKIALRSVSEEEQKNLIIRSDNRPQMSSHR